MEKNNGCLESLERGISIILGVIALSFLCIALTIFLGLNGFKVSIGGVSASLNEQRLPTQVVIVREITATPKYVEVYNPTPTPKIVCNYDYSIMPSGLDEFDNRLADKGIKVTGTIVGPSIVKIDKDHIVIIYPGNSWKGTGTLWQYVGDSRCLEAQLQYFEKEAKIYIK